MVIRSARLVALRVTVVAGASGSCAVALPWAWSVLPLAGGELVRLLRVGVAGRGPISQTRYDLKVNSTASR